jgi:hypothetical protein
MQRIRKDAKCHFWSRTKKERSLGWHSILTLKIAEQQHRSCVALRHDGKGPVARD